MGARARLRCTRHLRHRPRGRRSASHHVARCRSSWRDGLYGATRQPPRASRRARRGHGARDQRAHELLAGRGARCARGARRPDARVCRALCDGTRLSQGAARASRATCAAHGGGDRAVRLSRVHGQRAGARSRARVEGRHRMARQAYAAADARRGLVLLPRRDLHESAAAGDRAGDGALRHLQRVHRCVPNRRDRRPVRARRAPLHLVPHHRAQGQHPRAAAAAHRQSHLRLRRLPARMPVEPLRRGRVGAGLRVGAKRPRRRHAARPVRMDRGRVRSAHGRQRIRRIGYSRWMRNVAVALGNAPPSEAIVDALVRRMDHPSALVREHAAWALARQRAGA